MKNTTLCYIEKDGSYLMMLRNKKKNDLNEGKYVGIGGHFFENEDPYECMIREAREETGLDIKPKYRGIVTFISNEYESEQMHLFTSTEFSGELIDCNEGELVFVPKEKVKSLPTWEGDRIFFDLLDTREDFFALKLVYEGDKLVSYSIDGVKIR